MTLSLLLALLVSESILRLAYYTSTDLDIEMWKYAVKLKRATADTDAVFTHRADASAVLMGVPIALDRHGVRGTDVLVPKPLGTYRIAVAGDSFTLGWGVRTEETFVALLADQLNAFGGFGGMERVETINLGVGNYNTVQEVARIREVGLPLQPDLLVLAYYLNDAELQPSWRDGWLLKNSYLVAFLLSRWRHLTRRINGGEDVTSYYHRLYEADASGWSAASAAMRTLADVSRASSIPVVMYIIPDLHHLGASYPFRREHSMIASRAIEAGLTVVDLLPEFDTVSVAERLWVTPRDAHPNRLAHAMISDAMARTLNALLMSGLD